MRKRARDWGLPFPGTPGEYNAITDVPGVLVGYTTIIEGEGPLEIGTGPIRTGVTAILPRGHSQEMHPIWAGTYSLNGNGEMTGVHWVNDGGYFLSPICITNTHSVGITHHAAVQYMTRHYRQSFEHQHIWAMPVIAETYDGVLNDINGQHIRVEHVVSAIESATSGQVAEGNVGGGTGMICYEFKGGTGSASRVVPLDDKRYHIGALVQANHGVREWFTVLGVPIGQHVPLTQPLLPHEQGSIIVVIGTDMPMLPHQLRRVAKRCAIGIGRNGTPGGNSSGDLFLVFSTGNEMPIPQLAGTELTMKFINDEVFDDIYEATCQAVEEAVVNAMFAAESMSTVKPFGLTVDAISPREVVTLMHKYGRM